MNNPAHHIDEHQRLADLIKHCILDTPAETEFDEITSLAATICDVPMSLISLVDKDRLWFKSRFGVDVLQIPRENTFCNHAIKGNEILIVENSELDERFYAHPFYINGKVVKFYAGIPLLSSSGYVMGSLCVLDFEKKTLNKKQIKTLESFAKQVILLIELKLREEELKLLNDQYVAVQNMSQTGGWELDVASMNTIWSEGVYRIHNIPIGTPTNKVDGISYFAPHEQDRISNLIELLIKDGQSYEGEFEFYDATGVHKWVRSFAQPVFDRKGQLTKIVGTFQDVTAIVKSRLEIEKINKALINAQTISKVGSWSLDLVTKQRVYSEEYYSIFEIDSSLNQEELIKLYRSRVHPDDLAGLDRLMSVAQTSGERFTYDYRFLLDKGSRIKYIQVIGDVVKDSSGKQIFIYGTCRDRTEERESHHRLETTKAENDFIYDALGIGIWKFNPNTHELVWDNSMYNLYGIPSDKFSGDYQAWLSTLTPSGEIEAVKAIEMALKGEKEYNLTFEINYKGTEIRYMGARGKVIRNADGSPSMMYGANWDRTKEVELEKKLEVERLVSQHSARLANIGELAAGIGHEINNPLAIISGQIHIIEDVLENPENGPVEVKKRLVNMEKAVDRISNIVNTLRTFARSDDGVISDFDPYDLVFETVSMLQDLYSKEEVALSLFGNIKGSSIRGNRGRVQQALVNLISNARDATSGMPDRKIEVSVSYEAEDINIAIKDNGCGIPEAIVEDIFKPFFTTKDVNKGTGIGLSLVNSIIKEHKGKLELISNVGTGTTFTIKFPVIFNQSANFANVQKAMGTDQSDIIDCNVLIVDDEEDLREIFSFILSKICRNVVSVETAAQGYEIVKKGDIDLIISDVRMPKHDGFDFLQMIRQNNNIPQPKFILLTGGVDMSEDELKLIQTQTNGILTKPLDKNKIYKKMKELFPRWA